MRLNLEPSALADAAPRTEDGDTERGNAFCRLMNPGRAPLCAHCPLSVLKSSKCKGVASPVSGHCRAGLLELTAPVRFQNRTVARLWTGQVTLTPLMVGSFPLRAPGVWDVCPPGRLQEAAELWRRTPVVLPETLARYRIHMGAVAEQLSMRIDRLFSDDARRESLRRSDGPPRDAGAGDIEITRPFQRITKAQCLRSGL